MNAKLIYEGLKDKLSAPTKETIHNNITEKYGEDVINYIEEIFNSLNKIHKKSFIEYFIDYTTMFRYEIKNKYMWITLSYFYYTLLNHYNLSHNDIEKLIQYYSVSILKLDVDVVI